jgi:hypothetical protein
VRLVGKISLTAAIGIAALAPATVANAGDAGGGQLCQTNANGDLWSDLVGGSRTGSIVGYMVVGDGFRVHQFSGSFAYGHSQTSYPTDGWVLRSKLTCW